MSAILTAIGGSLLTSAADLLTFIPKGNIGGIDVQCTFEEIYSDTIELTDQPVEFGADITDHSFVKPSGIQLRCGWSNSGSAALEGSILSLFSGSISAASDYVSGIYSQLLALQQSRQPFNLVTTKRQYQNMLMPSLQVFVDEKTSQSLMVTAVCRVIIIVTTQATTLAPMSNQANPASTADVTQLGPQPLVEDSQVSISAIPADEFAPS